MEDKQRTLQQNKALHKYFEWLSEEFNNAGLDVRTVLSKDLYHPWNQKLVKELIWRKVQDSYLQKKSTTQLNTKEIDKVLEVITRWIGEQFGLTVPFPSIDLLIQLDNEQEKLNNNKI